jgi:hypothetical protein
MSGTVQAKRLSRRTAVRAAGGMTLAGVAASGLAHVAPVQAGGPDIVGSWRLTVTIAGDDAPPEMSLATFATGGTYIQSAGQPGTTAGHGVWQQVADGSYALTFVEYIFPEQEGAPMIALTVRARIALDASGDRFTAAFRFEAALPNGVVAQRGEGTALGARIQLLSS